MSMDLSPLWISLKVALVSTIITFTLGVLSAWFMTNYRGKGAALIDGLMTLPMVLPPTLVGFILLWIIGVNGPIGKLLGIWDIKIVFTWFAAVLASVVVSFPLMYRTSRGAFDQINMDLIHAARTLGSTEKEVFLRIVVPLAWPGIAAATALAFSRALGEFGATLMVAGSIPGKTETIPIAIYFATQGGDYKRAAVWVIIVFAISLVSMMFINRYQNKTVK
ncbi:MAG: molybdate ABC transporter permease subunit [Clostridia bacterium]|nr:molybdate ABC transporter permease subunit [Clostridia bacterium]